MEQQTTQIQDYISQLSTDFHWQKFAGEIQTSENQPAIVRENNTLIIPTFIWHDEENALWYFIPVTIPYKGQSLVYEKCVAQSYAELRRHFYGDALFQRELEDDDLLNSHITAVKLAFPKPNSEVVRKYSKYKIQRACEEIHIEGIENTWLAVEQAIKDSGKWSSWQNIKDIRSDNSELVAVLPLIKQAFPTVDVDAVLAKCLV